MWVFFSWWRWGEFFLASQLRLFADQKLRFRFPASQTLAYKTVPQTVLLYSSCLSEFNSPFIKKYPHKMWVFFYGGGEESWTPVRKPIRGTFYERSYRLNFPDIALDNTPIISGIALCVIKVGETIITLTAKMTPYFQNAVIPEKMATLN